MRILAGLGRAASIHKLLGKEYARLGSKFLNAVSDNPQQTYANFVSTLPSTPLAVKTLDDALEYDRNQYLISDVLAISDLTSMAHGLELRVPFLGQDVTSFARSKTAEELLRKGRKWILKELLIECGGKELIDYPKKGFGIDYQTLVQLKIHDQLFSFDFRTVLSDYVDQVYIDLLLKNPEKMDISLLWNLMITAHWLEQHR